MGLVSEEETKETTRECKSEEEARETTTKCKCAVEKLYFDYVTHKPCTRLLTADPGFEETRLSFCHREDDEQKESVLLEPQKLKEDRRFSMAESATPLAYIKAGHRHRTGRHMERLFSGAMNSLIPFF